MSPGRPVRHRQFAEVPSAGCLKGPGWRYCLRGCEQDPGTPDRAAPRAGHSGVPAPLGLGAGQGWSPGKGWRHGRGLMQELQLQGEEGSRRAPDRGRWRIRAPMPLLCLSIGPAQLGARRRQSLDDRVLRGQPLGAHHGREGRGAYGVQSEQQAQWAEVRVLKSEILGAI